MNLCALWEKIHLILSQYYIIHFTMKKGTELCYIGLHCNNWRCEEKQKKRRFLNFGYGNNLLGKIDELNSYFR